MDRTAKRGLFVALLAGAVTCSSRDARAGHGLSGALWVEAEGSVLPNATGLSPSFQVSDVSSSARSLIQGGTAPFGFPMGFAGFRSGLDLVLRDRTIVPVIDVGVFGILGTYSDVLTSVDGSLLRVSPASIFLIDAEASGIGLRFKHRRWMFSAAIKPGIAFMVANAAVADGKGFTSIDPLTAFSPTLRANLEICRRLDPLERACLVAQPNIYEWGWGNGGSLALRYEFGP